MWEKWLEEWTQAIDFPGSNPVSTPSKLTFSFLIYKMGRMIILSQYVTFSKVPDTQYVSVSSYYFLINYSLGTFGKARNSTEVLHLSRQDWWGENAKEQRVIVQGTHKSLSLSQSPGTSLLCLAASQRATSLPLPLWGAHNKIPSWNLGLLENKSQGRRMSISPALYLTTNPEARNTKIGYLLIWGRKWGRGRAQTNKQLISQIAILT